MKVEIEGIEVELSDSEALAVLESRIAQLTERVESLERRNAALVSLGREDERLRRTLRKAVGEEVYRAAKDEVDEYMANWQERVDALLADHGHRPYN